MLKNKITKITLVLLLALSLLVPIVRADDNEAEPISDSSQEKAVETTQVMRLHLKLLNLLIIQ